MWLGLRYARFNLSRSRDVHLTCSALHIIEHLEAAAYIGAEQFSLM